MFIRFAPRREGRRVNCLLMPKLLNQPSGNLFELTQNAGMGWNPEELGRKQFLILSTEGGMRAPDGTPIALGYHTGHWEIGLLVEAAAKEFRRLKTIPFAACCSDPCDGRTQGTTGMFDSLPYRNDAAQIFRRLIRSLPQRSGVLGIERIRDRKSTRLNSSHITISYAVFCLKKKKQQ